MASAVHECPPSKAPVPFALTVKAVFSMDILLWIVFGLVVGLVARLIMPGPDPGGIILTVVLGIVGAMLGGWLGRVMGLYREGDAAGFIMDVVGAKILVGLYRHVIPGRIRV